jgi:hypothetical protein
MEDTVLICMMGTNYGELCNWYSNCLCTYLTVHVTTEAHLATSHQHVLAFTLSPKSCRYLQKRPPVSQLCLKALYCVHPIELTIQFEFTARDTPQQNHLAELGFTHLANYGRALMARANVLMSIRYKVFTKAFKTATLLDYLTVLKIGNQEATRYEHWCGNNPEFSEYLRTWGEVGTVKIKTNATPRIGDRGIQCMFVGYSLDHTADCYGMWDPATLRVHQTRDVIWLNHMYYNQVEQADNIVVEPDMEPVIVYHTQNPEVNGPGEGDNHEELHVMNYNEAIKSGKDKWDYAVKEEHDRMTSNKVWKAVPIDKIPEGTKIMTSAWAMKKKSNGTYRARINARGFEQVDGEHCDQETKSSPVTCIVTIRIVITLIVMAAWAAHLMDVHGAFLKGKFRDGEVIYMKVPQGIEKFYPKNVALLLLRTIYGQVQAALAFWRETVAAFVCM